MTRRTKIHVFTSKTIAYAYNVTVARGKPHALFQRITRAWHACRCCNIPEWYCMSNRHKTPYSRNIFGPHSLLSMDGHRLPHLSSLTKCFALPPQPWNNIPAWSNVAWRLVRRVKWLHRWHGHSRSLYTPNKGYTPLSPKIWWSILSSCCHTLLFKLVKRIWCQIKITISTW